MKQVAEANAKYQSNLLSIQNNANAASAKGFGGRDLEATKGPKEGTINADSLAKIGGYLGGGGSVQTRIATLTERTARATERMAEYFSNHRGQKPAWGI